MRVSGQATRDGTARVPLKYRKANDFRDIPVPAWLWQLVRTLPAGPLCPGDKLYMPYNATRHALRRAAAKAKIPPSFTAHSLRHAFASSLLAAGVPITDVAVWMGHRDIATTFATYSHLIPSAAPKAAAVLDAEFAAWSAQ